MAAPALIPDAATYGAEQATAQQAYDKSKANLQTQQLGWLKQYGMTADANPTSGAYTNYRVDPYNQYGLIQQNRNSEALDLNAARDNAIGRGLGSTGLANQQTSALRYQHGVQDTNLGNSFMQGMGGFNQGLSDAANTYQHSLYQAQADAIQRALANAQFEQYFQGMDSGGNMDGGNNSTGPGTNNNTNPFVANNGSAGPQNANLTRSEVNPYGDVVTARKKIAAALAAQGGGGRGTKNI